MSTPYHSDSHPQQQQPQQQQHSSYSASFTSSTSPTFTIPQLVVIRDQVHDTYKHPILHYVFEDEPFPDIPKDKLIVVDYDTEVSTTMNTIDEPRVQSYSPQFQVSHARLEQSTVNDQFDHSTAGLVNLILEGVSAPQTNEAIESLQPLRNVDGLMEMIFNYKNRNEMVKKVFQQQQ